jgi:hypothetical protein
MRSLVRVSSSRSSVPHVTVIGIGFLVGLALTVPACEEVGNVAKQCGLDVDCEAGGFAEGKASISGVASVDAFFGAAIDLDASMRGLSGEIRAELDAIGASVGVAPGAGGAEIAAAVDAHLAAYVEGGLTIDYQPARCAANIEASVAAAAQCDAEVDPGSVTVRCEGSCKAEAGVAVECEGGATLMCTGTAPGLQCDGTCSGSCAVELTAAASCDGTCRGSCTADGSTMDGFDGRCNAQCEGECVTQMSAGGTCNGNCEGSCEYKAPEGGCEASAEARCEAEAGASIECDAGCEGSAEPPMVSAECEATVDAKASASIECTPPTVDIAFSWSASVAGDVAAQAEFRAWLEGFRAHIAAIIALRAKGEVVGEAAVNLLAAADGAVRDAFTQLRGEAEPKLFIGAKCALLELPVAVGALQASAGALTGEVAATGEVFASIGAG